MRRAVFSLMFVCCLATAADGLAQSGMRESLERLDRNENGWIDPDEITPLARPYLERIAETRRLRLDRPIEISELQIAARIHHAIMNGVSGRRVRADSGDTVKKFGMDDDEVLVPGFGLPRLKYLYTQDDLDEADNTLRRSDWNDDGFIDRREARYARWTHRDPFEDDMNGDMRLSRMELAQRYARRRQLEDASGELVRKAWRTGGEIKPTRKSGSSKRDNGQWWREGGNTHWLTAAMMGRFDSNRNGRLEANEAANIGIPPGKIDTDRNGEITRDELFEYIGALQNQAGDVTQGLPGWFFEKDLNEDGQVAVAEYLGSEPTLAGREEFSVLDLNSDGLLTAEEALNSKAITGGIFRNEEAQILPPRRTTISELEIEDNILIKDLNVQLSITHTHTGHLDAFLITPDEQQIELFTEVGGSGDHFSGTIMDDQAGTPIVKGRPPYEGHFRPEAIDKKQPGLSSLNGKSAKGIWKLSVRGTRSDRFGMLHSWSINITPEEKIPVLAEDEEANEAETEETDGDDPENQDKKEPADSEGSPKAKPDAPKPAPPTPPNSGNPLLKLFGAG